MTLKGNFTFTHRNVLYDRHDVERIIDSDILMKATLERYRSEYEKVKNEVNILKDQVAILTHKKP